MKFILFLTLLFILSVTSCESDCAVPNLRFDLVGFSDAEADTIILRRFTKSNSSTQMDTFIFKQIMFNRHNDTLEMAGIPLDSYLSSYYNYEIFFPEGGKLFTISDIVEEKKTRNKSLFSCTKEYCSNTITGYTVNGQFSNAIVDWDLIYLKK